MKVLLTIWISALLIQEVVPSTLVRLPRQAPNKTSLVHTEYEAKYEQKGKHGNESFSTLTGKQQFVHDNCSENWNAFADKCASLIKDLVASLANVVSSKPGDATNLQLHIKNTFRHFDNTNNCTCLNHTGQSLSDLDLSPLFNNITINTVTPHHDGESSHQDKCENCGHEGNEPGSEGEEPIVDVTGVPQRKKPNGLTENPDMHPSNAGHPDDPTNNNRRQAKYPQVSRQPGNPTENSDSFDPFASPFSSSDHTKDGTKIPHPFLVTPRPAKPTQAPVLDGSPIYENSPDTTGSNLATILHPSPEGTPHGSVPLVTSSNKEIPSSASQSLSGNNEPGHNNQEASEESAKGRQSVPIEMVPLIPIKPVNGNQNKSPGNHIPEPEVFPEPVTDSRTPKVAIAVPTDPTTKGHRNSKPSLVVSTEPVTDSSYSKPAKAVPVEPVKSVHDSEPLAVLPVTKEEPSTVIPVINSNSQLPESSKPDFEDEKTINPSPISEPKPTNPNPSSKVTDKNPVIFPSTEHKRNRNGAAEEQPTEKVVIPMKGVPQAGATQKTPGADSGDSVVKSPNQETPLLPQLPVNSGENGGNKPVPEDKAATPVLVYPEKPIAVVPQLTGNAEPGISGTHGDSHNPFGPLTTPIPVYPLNNIPVTPGIGDHINKGSTTGHELTKLDPNHPVDGSHDLQHETIPEVNTIVSQLEHGESPTASDHQKPIAIVPNSVGHSGHSIPLEESDKATTPFFLFPPHQEHGVTPSVLDSVKPAVLVSNNEGQSGLPQQDGEDGKSCEPEKATTPPVLFPSHPEHGVISSVLDPVKPAVSAPNNEGQSGSPGQDGEDGKSCEPEKATTPLVLFPSHSEHEVIPSVLDSLKPTVSVPNNEGQSGSPGQDGEDGKSCEPEKATTPLVLFPSHPEHGVIPSVLDPVKPAISASNNEGQSGLPGQDGEDGKSCEPEKATTPLVLFPSVPEHGATPIPVAPIDPNIAPNGEAKHSGLPVGEIGNTEKTATPSFLFPNIPEQGVTPPALETVKPVAVVPEDHHEHVDPVLLKPTTFQTTSANPTPAPLPFLHPTESTKPLTLPSHPHDSGESLLTKPITSPKTPEHDEEDDDEDCCSCESCTEEEITDPKQIKDTACRNLEEARRELKRIFDKITKKLKCGRKAPQSITATVPT